MFPNSRCNFCADNISIVNRYFHLFPLFNFVGGSSQADFKRTIQSLNFHSYLSCEIYVFFSFFAEIAYFTVFIATNRTLYKHVTLLCIIIISEFIFQN